MGAYTKVKYYNYISVGVNYHTGQIRETHFIVYKAIVHEESHVEINKDWRTSKCYR